ncbi:hypothetical protein MNBD_BACTEROID01-1328 [hydrothermal vent metagenome]|uniref:Thioredoxin domain-containing protein n=1 Tax=hydrothermal vent metagenome TaxID=652676 RepID=A0A3B0TRT6_9ZZZZ
MNTIKKWSLLSFSIICFLALTACGNSNTGHNQVNSNVEVKQSTQPEQQTDVTAGSSKIQAELGKAKKAGKAVFVVVTDTGSADTDKALALAKEAKTINKNVEIIQMNRDDASNAQFVAEWRLAGAPLPLILVLSSKGVPTGGYKLEQATAENIAALIPSPKLEAVYDAIGSKKHAIIVFSKKTFTDKSEVVKIAKEAVSMLNSEAVFVEVDMDDPKETGFMNQLRIDKASAKASITIVINKQGQVAGISKTVPDAAKLVAAANAPVKSGCGPGCGPAGCGK